MILGPCDWPLIFGTVALTAFEELDDQAIPDDEQLPSDAVKAAAVNYLWNWTGRVYGPCEVTVELCLEGCTATERSVWWFNNQLISFPFLNPLRVCDIGCSCWNDRTLARLPGPINTVSEVMIDGIVIAPAGWSIINRSFVQLTNGQVWPQCGVAPVKVTYTKGLPVPEGGQIAAGALALEMAKALTGDAKCQLPRRVQSITRQGIEVAMIDTFSELESGKTGLWQVDSWVASVTRSRGAAGRVYSVDMRGPGRARFRR